MQRISIFYIVINIVYFLKDFKKFKSYYCHRRMPTIYFICFLLPSTCRILFGPNKDANRAQTAGRLPRIIAPMDDLLLPQKCVLVRALSRGETRLKMWLEKVKNTSILLCVQVPSVPEVDRPLNLA